MIQAIEGLLLGLVTGGLSIYSLWLITGFTASLARDIQPKEPSRWLKRFAPFKWDDEDFLEEDEKPVVEDLPEPAPPVTTSENLPPISSAAATIRLLSAFLLKIPIVVALALVAQSMGDVFLHWCVGGVVLVYFLAVFWAAFRTNRQ